MKYKLLIPVAVLFAQSAFGQMFSLNFTGEFIDGVLNNHTIEGFIEIDTDGQSSGTADIEITTSGPELFDFSIEILDPSDGFVTSFDLFDDLSPLADFDTIAPATEPSVVGMDYFGTNFLGEQLNLFYDAFASDAASGISVVFDDGVGGISNGTLDLATAVPEPNAFGLLLGLGALVGVLTRRVGLRG